MSVFISSIWPLRSIPWSDGNCTSSYTRVHPHPESDWYEVGDMTGNPDRYVTQILLWKSSRKVTSFTEEYSRASSEQRPPLGWGDGYRANRRSSSAFGAVFNVSLAVCIKYVNPSRSLLYQKVSCCSDPVSSSESCSVSLFSGIVGCETEV
jgi:hypothetical protein